MFLLRAQILPKALLLPKPSLPDTFLLPMRSLGRPLSDWLGCEKFEHGGFLPFHRFRSLSGVVQEDGCSGFEDPQNRRNDRR